MRDLASHIGAVSGLCFLFQDFPMTTAFTLTDEGHSVALLQQQREEIQMAQSTVFVLRADDA